MKDEPSGSAWPQSRARSVMAAGGPRPHCEGQSWFIPSRAQHEPRAPCLAPSALSPFFKHWLWYDLPASAPSAGEDAQRVRGQTAGGAERDAAGPPDPAGASEVSPGVLCWRLVLVLSHREPQVLGKSEDQPAGVASGS